MQQESVNFGADIRDSKINKMLFVFTNVSSKKKKKLGCHIILIHLQSNVLEINFSQTSATARILSAAVSPSERREKVSAASWLRRQVLSLGSKYSWLCNVGEVT